jgi:hypothetical protein
VDEALDGKWTNGKATVTIEGMTMRWENDHNNHQHGDSRETCQSLNLQYKNKQKFIVEWPQGSGKVYTGELTEDGFLTLQKTARDNNDGLYRAGEPQIWCRASQGRSVPTCFVRRDPEGILQPCQKRVHVFDGDSVAERIPEERTLFPEEVGGQHMLQLDKVWSALSKTGEFSEDNTLMIHARRDGVSHRSNVLVALPWQYWEEERDLRRVEELRKYVVDRLACSSSSVLEYLRTNL